ncbi:ABC transporter permease [Cyanobium sp. FGCU-6]|jgi:spermidine/putrescine transport system permease protein|nr:ABC transporter permease [Cyanobium sp. FGCU6]
MSASRRSLRAEPRTARTRRQDWLPWLLVAPGLTWLVLWFVLPLAQLLPVSLSDTADRFRMTLVFSGRIANYTEVIGQYTPVLARSLVYAGAATALAVLIAYPLAWVIRFRGGRWKAVLLALVVVPFFTPYLVRAIAWTTLLGDDGPLLSALRAVGLPQGTRLLNTAFAVVGGLTYNALPFMVLPITLSLERIPTELLDAARDLQGGPWTVFRRVVLPLSAPGLAAGIVLSLIPAAGDVVNPQFLGGPNNRMIGNVMQSLMLVQRQLPRGAALALVLMALMTATVVVHVRRHGSSDLTLT